VQGIFHRQERQLWELVLPTSQYNNIQPHTLSYLQYRLYSSSLVGKSSKLRFDHLQDKFFLDKESAHPGPDYSKCPEDTVLRQQLLHLY
jgi:hypothetical protein